MSFEEKKFHSATVRAPCLLAEIGKGYELSNQALVG